MSLSEYLVNGRHQMGLIKKAIFCYQTQNGRTYKFTLFNNLTQVIFDSK